jgi:myosin heavy subunit
MKAKEPNPKEATNVIANLILPKEDWQLGKTKIFLKVAPLDYVYCEWINLC